MLKRIFLFFLSILPLSSNAENKKGIQILLNNGDYVKINSRGKLININFNQAKHILEASGVSVSNSIGVRLHEESNVVDFSAFNGRTIRVNFSDVEGATPNGWLGK